MTAGREKKPFDYEIPDRGRTQKRVFDDTEPLIVNGRPLEPEVTMEPSKNTGHTDTRADYEVHSTDGRFSKRLMLLSLGALIGLFCGILFTRALTPEPSSAGLYIEPLTDTLQIGTVTDLEPQAPNAPVLLSIDFGPLGTKKGWLDIGHNEAWTDLKGRKVAAIVGRPVFADQTQTDVFVIGLVDPKTVNVTGQKHD